MDVDDGTVPHNGRRRQLYATCSGLTQQLVDLETGYKKRPFGNRDGDDGFMEYFQATMVGAILSTTGKIDLGSGELVACHRVWNSVLPIDNEVISGCLLNEFLDMSLF